MEIEELFGPDAALPEVRAEWEIARAEFASDGMNRAAAELYGSIANTLADARSYPEVWVDIDARQAIPTDLADFAVRSAVLDISSRLGMSESTVRAHAAIAETLRSRAPRVWVQFVDGQVSVANARAVSEVALTLPNPPPVAEGETADDHAAAVARVKRVWSDFDSAIVEAAIGLTPPRFRTKVRAVREDVHPRSLHERHEVARESRRVWVEQDVDGMAWLGIHLSTEAAHCAQLHITAQAEQLKARPGETRTLDQLRADVAGDLLTGGAVGDGAVSVSVAVTIPVMTLLGMSERPATMDGIIPIPAERARELTARATSLRRLLTDPVTSAVLDFDTRRYRPTNDLKRMVGMTSPVCAAPGCGRRSADCDIDHIIAREHRGATSYRNLTPLCRGHHRIKHVSRWRTDRTATGALRWTSPTGNTTVTDTDPPPF